MDDLNEMIGNADIYLIDQILKGSFDRHQFILDAGCGLGRNLIYFLKNNFRIYGIDQNPEAIEMVHHQLKGLPIVYPHDRFTVGKVESLPYRDQMFDRIISSAVLHFAESESHFQEMFAEQIRVLKNGGLLFARTACDLGMDGTLKPMGKGVFFLPDGTVRFLLTKSLLAELMKMHHLEFAEPFKTVLVDGKRSMSVLVLRKSNA